MANLLIILLAVLTHLLAAAGNPLSDSPGVDDGTFQFSVPDPGGPRPRADLDLGSIPARHAEAFFLDLASGADPDLAAGALLQTADFDHPEAANLFEETRVGQ